MSFPFYVIPLLCHSRETCPCEGRERESIPILSSLWKRDKQRVHSRGFLYAFAEKNQPLDVILLDDGLITSKNHIEKDFTYLHPEY